MRLQCAPSDDELKLLRSFLEAGGQPDALADAEKFAYELGQVSIAMHSQKCWTAAQRAQLGKGPSTVGE